MTVSHSLSAEGVTLSYGDRTIIDGLDLTVAPGKITTIVGANGCGKSTLLRALARLLSPREGAEQRRLAASVRPHDRGDAAGRDDEVESLDDRPIAVGHGQPLAA